MIFEKSIRRVFCNWFCRAVVLSILSTDPAVAANFNNAHIALASSNPYSIVGIGNENLWVFSNAQIGGVGSYSSDGSGNPRALATTLAYNGQQFVSLLLDTNYATLLYNVYTAVTYGEGTISGPYVDTVTFTLTPAEVTYVTAKGGTVSIGAISNNVLPFSFSPNPARLPTPTVYGSGTSYRGVNLPGGEFDGFDLPPYSNAIYYIYKGMNIVRIPFAWENIQPNLGVAIDFTAGNARQLAQFVANLASAAPGMHIILDMHNYMRYNGNIIGAPGSPVTAGQYAAAWAAFATQFSGYPNVMFDLMNEPHDMATELILSNYNTAMASIRMNGFSNLVLLEGNGYSCLATWTSNYYGTPNSTIFTTAAIMDSNYAINAHEYFDGNGGTAPCGGGETSLCVPAESVGIIENFDLFTSYLQANSLKAIVTELNAVPGANCVQCIQNFLTLIEGEAYTPAKGWGFIGWSAWASLNISPADPLSLVTNIDGTDRAQWTAAYNDFLTPPSWTP